MPPLPRQPRVPSRPLVLGGLEGSSRFDQADRALLLEPGAARTFRKTARILAVQIDHPFSVETSRGLMRGAAGDWLVTNRPEDDAGSDLWIVADERMTGTYEEVAG